MGCGPSLRHGQRSQVYFERCYAADLDARISATDKHSCWSSWLEHYTIGATDGQRTYARERLEAIALGEPTPRLPGMPEAALGPRAKTLVTVSSAASAASEPLVEGPRSSEGRGRHSRRNRRIPPLPHTTNPTCAAAACESTWRSCIDECANVRACAVACRIELNTCARGCF